MANNIELQLISKIWPDESVGTFNRLHYLRFLTDLEKSSAVLCDRNAPYATSNLDETLSLLERMRTLAQANVINNTNISAELGLLTRNVICNALTQSPQPGGWHSPANESIVKSLCLALSLRLCIEVSPIRPTRTSFGAAEWHDTSTISDLIIDAFPKPDTATGPYVGAVLQLIRAQNSPPNPAAPQHAPPQGMAAQNAPPAPNPPQNIPPGVVQPLPVDFRLTLEYLCTYHSFEVIWTGNLKEHLQIRWRGTHHSRPRIMVFEHKIFLWNELRFSAQSLLPRDLVEEAIDTLNLLLPYNDYHTAKFLKLHQRHAFYTLGWCGRGRSRDLNQYLYFKDRISELSDIVKTTPTGLPQLKLDRGGRNIMEFLNFWVALLVAVFTVFSIAFGTASLVLSKWQYDIAVVQYKLSLAQVCATTDSASLYPQLCRNGNGTIE